MAPRLHLKHGLVADADRLPSAADTVVVTEPSTGSKSRTKGSLYVVVTSRRPGGRAADATELVANTIRREYYYDESAGIAIILEKTVRSANRQLRHGREGHGLAPGSIGVALAVVRGNELYVATIGDAEVFLVRSARLLMPEREIGEGLPAPDAMRVDVWRGEIAVGDSLLLASRNLTEVVGTEELKNAVVTLHPQSAAEHLHHLFAAAGGEGSDGLIVIEGTDSSATRADHRLVPVGAGDGAMADLGGSPIPLADRVAGAASAVQGSAIQAREAVGGAFTGFVDRLVGSMPRRRTSYRRIAPTISRRETQRRVATALLAFLGVVLVTGVLVWAVPRGQDPPIQQVNAGESAFASARDKVNEVFGQDDLLATDEEEALELLRDALADLARAEATGVTVTRTAPLRAQIAEGLDQIHDARYTSAETIARLPGGGASEIADLVEGPDGAAYVLDQEARTISRVDPDAGEVVEIIRAGDGPGEGIGTPSLLSVGGPDLLIVDNRGGLWRWRPSDDVGGGTLGPISVGGDTGWGDDVIDVSTFLLPQQAEDGLYNLYVADPSANQILRYQPTADGSGFSSPTNYLATENEDVSTFRQLLIDGDIYALTAQDAIRHESGRQQDFSLGVPPDDADLRPGRDYRFLAATGGRREGRLWVWDAQHSRILAFDKASGAYLEQFFPTEPDRAPFEDLRGMYVVEAEVDGEPTPTAEPSPPEATADPEATGDPELSPEPEETSASPDPDESIDPTQLGPPPTLVWLTGEGLFRSVLEDEGRPDPESTETDEPEPTVGASRSPATSPDASSSPRAGRTTRPTRTP